MQGASRLDQIVLGLRNGFTEQLWQQLLGELSARPPPSTNPQNPSALESFLRQTSTSPSESYYQKLHKYIGLAYQKRGELLKILYRLLPLLMQKYVQINYIKMQGLEECLIDVYNWEYKRYNAGLGEKKELCADPVVKRLYEEHLGKEMLEGNVGELEPIKEINNMSRISMKSLIFYLIYRQAGSYNEQCLADYYRLLFIYCGAEQRDLNTTGSLYLLQKINKVSIFKYSINEDQLQWIILTLYELCTQVKKDKFQLLAVINLMHKKVSNQSLFRMSDVCNSLIHLLEDQYSEIFV